MKSIKPHALHFAAMVHRMPTDFRDLSLGTNAFVINFLIRMWRKNVATTNHLPSQEPHESHADNSED